jgi:uncharacterized membrane protein
MTVKNEFAVIAILGLLLLALVVLGAVLGAQGIQALPAPLALLRLFLGLAFVLFVPGYALQVALFPRPDALEGPERLALSLGLSVAVVPPLALLLDALPWGIRLWPIVVTEGLVIAVCSAVALWRRARLPVQYQARLRLEVDVRGWWAEQDRTGRILYGVLAFALLLAIGSALTIVVLPKPGQHFTEFYVLGSEGLAENYPRQVAAGEPISLTASIANREGTAAEYLIEVRDDDQLLDAVGPVLLQDGEVWESSVSYALSQAGDDQKVEFLLYRDGGSEPYRSLRLWIDVVEGK